MKIAAEPEIAAGRAKAAADSLVMDHIMISYCWLQQETAKRIRTFLGRLGYKVWIDVEQMSGSTVDAMADAVDHSSAVCFGISLEYKESANCKMEAQYAMQAGKQLVPMMLVDGYRPNGCGKFDQVTT